MTRCARFSIAPPPKPAWAKAPPNLHLSVISSGVVRRAVLSGGVRGSCRKRASNRAPPARRARAYTRGGSP
jgi:hypothetical protein